MGRAIAISIISLVLQSAQAVPQEALATGAIEGTVVRADTGDPISGAQVSLASVNIALPGAPNVVGSVTDSAGAVRQLIAPVGVSVPEALSGALIASSRPPSFQPVTTGADGKFSFKNLNAGSYRVAATANGFVRTEYEQRSSYGQGRPVLVTAGQIIKDAAIRLAATGTVMGRVYDDVGQPATGAPIQLVRAVYNLQGRNLQSVGTGSVDDRGDYRVYGLPPGRYYLLAGTPPGPPRPGAFGGGPVSADRFSMVYYPNAGDLDRASTIEVKAGAETSVDMRLSRQTQTYRVRGRIVNATGAALPANVNVMLAYRFLNAGGSFGGGRILDPATGEFELQNVTPGDYTVQVQYPVTNNPLPPGPVDPAALAARQAEQASRPSASVPIHVVDMDIEGLRVIVTTGVSVAGRVVVDGQPITSVPNLERMRFTITAPNPIFNQPSPTSLPLGADGTFQVVGLREGEYHLQVNVPPGYYAKGIQYGGDDILNKPFKFSGSGSGTFEVTLRQGAAQINGTVTDAKSQPVPGIQVLLIPGQRNRSDLYRPAVTDQSGHFSLTGLPPGEYRVFCWETIDNGAQFDPDFLKQYEQQGKAVQLAESSTQNVDVRLIPAP